MRRHRRKRRGRRDRNNQVGKRESQTWVRSQWNPAWHDPSSIFDE
jgi:hypothetical protein